MGTLAISRPERDQSTIDSGYRRTCRPPSTSDSTNHCVAAQWPVLQNDTVGRSASMPSRRAVAPIACGEASCAVPGTNQTVCSTFFAPTSVPGARAAGCFFSPRKKAAGRASSSRDEELPDAAATCARVASQRSSMRT